MWLVECEKPVMIRTFCKRNTIAITLKPSFYKRNSLSLGYKKKRYPRNDTDEEYYSSIDFFLPVAQWVLRFPPKNSLIKILEGWRHWGNLWVAPRLSGAKTLRGGPVAVPRRTFLLFLSSDRVLKNDCAAQQPQDRHWTASRLQRTITEKPSTRMRYPAAK